LYCIDDFYDQPGGDIYKVSQKEQKEISKVMDATMRVNPRLKTYEIDDLVRDDQPWMKDPRCMRSIFGLAEKPRVVHNKTKSLNNYKSTDLNESKDENKSKENLESTTLLKTSKLQRSQNKDFKSGKRAERDMIQKLKKEMAYQLRVS